MVIVVLYAGLIGGLSTSSVPNLSLLLLALFAISIVLVGGLTVPIGTGVGIIIAYGSQNYGKCPDTQRCGDRYLRVFTETLLCRVIHGTETHIVVGVQPRERRIVADEVTDQRVFTPIEIGKGHSVARTDQLFHTSILNFK